MCSCLPAKQIEMLLTIFRVLGTPNEATWPGVSSMPFFNEAFPRYPARALRLDSCCCGGLEEVADAALLRDLVAGLCRLDPAARLTASAAMRHPYFEPLFVAS